MLVVGPADTKRQMPASSRLTTGPQWYITPPCHSRFSASCTACSLSGIGPWKKVSFIYLCAASRAVTMTP